MSTEKMQNHHSASYEDADESALPLMGEESEHAQMRQVQGDFDHAIDEFEIEDMDDNSSKPTSTVNVSKLRSHPIYRYAYAAITSHIGLKFALLAQICYALMGCLAKLLESPPPATESSEKFEALDPTQVILFRMALTVIMAYIGLYIAKVPNTLLGPPEVRGLLLTRGVCGFIGIYALYYALQYIHLSESTVIAFLSPLVTGFQAWMIVGERVLLREIIGSLISLVGVLIIARPAFLTKILAIHTVAPDVSPDTVQHTKAIIVAVVGVIIGSITSSLIRKIGHRAHALVSLQYFALCSIPLTILVWLFSGDHHIVWPSARQWGLLWGTAISGFSAQFLMAAAIQRERASTVTNFTYTQILWSIVYEKIIWNHVPDAWTWAGGTLILGCAIWVAIATSKDEPTENKEDIELGLATVQPARP